MNAMSWFYQFLIQRRDRSKFIVISYRGQEQSSVALMRFKNSLSYVQRQTNMLLRNFRSFARVYIDDIVIFSKTLAKHLDRLRQLFRLFKNKNVSLSSSKSFLEYSSIQLLDQRVDSLELTIFAKKSATIAILMFSKSLSDLDHFLDLTKWLRHMIHRYSQRAQSLQLRKIMLTRKLSKHDIKKNKRTISKLARKRHFIRIMIDNLIDEKIESFRSLQRELDSLIILMHFDLSRRLYVNLDASKKWDFATMIYYVLEDSKDNKSAIISRTLI